MLTPIGEVLADTWREEIKRHWPLRRTCWRRELIRQYVALIRLREDKRSERVVSIYRTGKWKG